jgi:hypothetical protein
VLSTNQNALIGIGALAKMALGSTTVVDGLIGTQTTTPSLTINIGPGSILSLQQVDANAYGSLGTNTNPLVKMGINLTTTQFTLTPPGTSGQSINYLIEAQFLEQDGTPVVLPYVNPSNPANPYSGPANAGTAQNTVRAETVSLQLKAGVAATTGTQTTPSTDSGWVALYVVTVNYGQTTITTSQITLASGAPFVDPLQAGRGIQPGRLLNVQIFSTPGTSTYTPTPGTNSVEVEVQGAGGASSGSPATLSGQASSGGGGGAGAWAWKRILSGFSGVTVTVGAGGAPAAGAAGGNGGASSFGALVAANGGGGGGPAGPTTSTATFNASSGAGGSAGVSGAINTAGSQGYQAVTISGAFVFFPYLPSRYGITFGSGGNPTANAASTAATTGGAGGGGIVIVREYT